MFKRIVVGSAIAAAGWAGYVAARQWYRTWGIDPVEAERILPGDDLVTDPSACDTRGITIEAPPEAVWPWLVQMGYGRGGWYSYDAIDMKGASSDAILPEHQSLAVGDIVPTDPGGGFIVKVVEPERALVLYIDPEVLATRKDAPVPAAQAPGLAVSGRFLETATPPQFTAAWIFALEPLDGGRTRLIERFRVRMDEDTPASRFLAPVLGFGVFVMTQRQMQGLKSRAEKLARDRVALHRDVDAVVEGALATDATLAG
ncbi:MAG: SRPBCC family protein [Chloroflexota bacterium]